MSDQAVVCLLGCLTSAGPRKVEGGVSFHQGRSRQHQHLGWKIPEMEEGAWARESPGLGLSLSSDI